MRPHDIRSPLTFLTIASFVIAETPEEKHPAQQIILSERQAWILQSIDTDQHIAQLDCFLTHADSWNRQEQANECCEAIFRCPVHVVDRKRVPALCAQSLVRLPPSPIRPSRKLPHYSLVEAFPRSSTSFQSVSSTDSVSSSWKHMLWDDKLRQGVWFDQNSKDLLANFLSTSSLVPDASPFAANITSQWATGRSHHGMHRELHHSLRVVVDDADDDCAGLELYVLLHLPSDLFVNTQDAIEGPKGWNISLLLTDEMDEEEPQFVSRPHAVVVRLSGGNIETTSSAIHMDWITKVHVRYPTPLNDEGDYSRIVMLPPVLVAGRCVKREEGSNDSYLILEPQGLDHQDYPPPLIGWVAAGKTQDFPLVVTVTVLATLLGTVILWRNIGSSV